MKKKKPEFNVLEKCVKKHGKSKTAVAIGLKDTNALSNWIARKEVPFRYVDAVKNLKNLQFVDVSFLPVKS